MGVLSWLWGSASSEQVQVIEKQEPTFKERLEHIASTSRGLSQRTAEERAAFIEDISEALDILDAAIDVLDATDLANRAKQTRAKLRGIRTRAQKAA